MPSASHFTWQIAVYGAIALTYLGVATSLLTARSTLRKWLAASFLVIYLENVVAFLSALCGFEPHEWLLGHPQTTQYLAIVLASMWITLVVFFVLTRRPRLPRLLNELPPLRVAEGRVRNLLLLGSLFCAALSIMLSAGGYSGYFIADSYVDTPPPWRDTVASMANLGPMVNFVLLLFGYVRYGRILGPEWVLLLLWTAAGLASGFKMPVILPFFSALVAAWLANRLGSRHWAFLVLALMLAYGVIEPMRESRWNAGHDNAVRGLYDLTTSEGVTLPELDDVAMAFLARLDYSVTAVQALEADHFGQINAYRERLREAYWYLPALTFVPRLVWPNKPLANLGSGLSTELSGVVNSVTPSTVVDSYLWGGHFGLVLNSILTAYFLVLAGLLLTNYMDQPLRYVPVLLLVPVLAMPTQIKAFHYIIVIRALLLTVLFYLIARRLGIVRDRLTAVPFMRPTPGSMTARP